SATMTRSTSVRGISATTAAIDSASLKVGMMTATEGRWFRKACIANPYPVLAGLVPAIPFLMRLPERAARSKSGHDDHYKLQRNPQLAQAPGGRSDFNALRKSR